MKYEIKEVDASAGNVAVRYFDEIDPAGVTLSIDLPIEDGAFPAGDRLHQLLRGYAPTYFYSRSRALQSGVDASHIVALIGQTTDI